MTKYGHPDSPEGKEKQATLLLMEKQKRQQAIEIERRRWWELKESYRRCVEIADHIWADRLERAQEKQEGLATQMRDRTAEGVRATGAKYEIDRGVPVPLFTPRDREQFIKEVATTLLISADRQNLPVTPEANREAQPVEAQEPTEAASGVAEALDLEAQSLDATQADGVALP